MKCPKCKNKMIFISVETRGFENLWRSIDFLCDNCKKIHAFELKMMIENEKE